MSAWSTKRIGYVLLRSAAGPGVKMRLHDEQRQSWTISSFFLRTPLRLTAWLPQYGHSMGSLFVCGDVAGRSGERDIRGTCGGSVSQVTNTGR